MTEATRARGQRIALGFVVLWVAMILVLTMKPAPGERTTGLLCVFCGGNSGADALRNLLFFVPLGVAAAMARRPTWTLLSAAVLLPVSIETVQFFIPGRAAHLGDVIFNAAGAFTGVALVRAWCPLAERTPGLSGLAAALGSAGVFVLTGLLVSPALPDSAYTGEWTPQLAKKYRRYRGTVLGASVGPLPLPAQRIGPSATIRELLARGAPVRASIIAGRRPGNLAPVIRVRDERQREIFLLGVDREDLVVRLRSRAQVLALEETDVRWVGGMKGVARRDTVSLEAWWDADGLCMGVDGNVRCGLGYTVGDGWRFVMSNRLWPEWVDRVLTLLWIFGLLFAVGWWSRGATQTILAAAGLLVLMFALPLGTTLVSTPPLQGATALAGIFAGLLVRRLTVRQLTRRSRRKVRRRRASEGFLRESGRRPRLPPP